MNVIGAHNAGGATGWNVIKRREFRQVGRKYHLQETEKTENCKSAVKKIKSKLPFVCLTPAGRPWEEEHKAFFKDEKENVNPVMLCSVLKMNWLLIILSRSKTFNHACMVISNEVFIWNVLVATWHDKEDNKDVQLDCVHSKCNVDVV